MKDIIFILFFLGFLEEFQWPPATVQHETTWVKHWTCAIMHWEHREDAVLNGTCQYSSSYFRTWKRHFKSLNVYVQFGVPQRPHWQNFKIRLLIKNKVWCKSICGKQVWSFSQEICVTLIIIYTVYSFFCVKVNCIYLTNSIFWKIAF